MSNRSSLSVNDTPIAASVEPRMTLADFLRDFCRCTGFQGIVAAAHRAAEIESVTQR
jgi:aerobic-type carbon monoxide dehydrogenase small subunit (CoxS/CutS family)